MKERTITYADLLIFFIIGIIIGAILSTSYCHSFHDNNKVKIVPDTIKVENLKNNHQMARR